MNDDADVMARAYELLFSTVGLLKEVGQQANLQAPARRGGTLLNACEEQRAEIVEFIERTTWNPTD